jgi:hypothetical protein
MSLSVHLGFFSSLASLRPRDVLARLGHIVGLYLSPNTLLGGAGVTGAGPTA